MSMSEKHAAYQKVLSKYIPEAFVAFVTDLLMTHKV
jgi:hypothetical protein